MRLAVALLAGLGGFAALVILVAFLQRSFFAIRQLAFLLYVAALAAALRIYALFAVDHTQEARALLSWTLLFLGFATVLRILALVIFDIHLRGRKGMKLPPLLPSVAMFLVYTVVAFITLKVTFPGFDITPLLATSAITSLVLGLALQPILANFFAGLVISLERPFRLNDWIKVGDQEGRVVAITWRTTHLRTRDNDNLVIPNSKMAEERVLNYFYPHPMHLQRVKVAVDPKHPPYRVRRALLDCAAGVPGTVDKPSAEVYVLDFEASSVVYELRVYIDDVAHSPRISSDLRARIWEELRRGGISLSYPTSIVELAPRERGRPAEPAAAGAPVQSRLYVAEGAERGRTLELNGTAAIVGRSRSCALALSDSNASKEHLRIEWTPEGFVMTDLGSSFGTRVNGQAASRTLLKPLDRIGIGDTVLIFESDVR
ncbi:MAG TPA: mechanosensitive ion channel domain-containing protein [Thermoanaerobaculia bacterium]|nr:mechanosensitive ion channel domain-containing protein [Thermoanaerobaculia bacterium]